MIQEESDSFLGVQLTKEARKKPIKITKQFIKRFLEPKMLFGKIQPMSRSKGRPKKLEGIEAIYQEHYKRVRGLYHEHIRLPNNRKKMLATRFRKTEFNKQIVIQCALQIYQDEPNISRVDFSKRLTEQAQLNKAELNTRQMINILRASGLFRF